MCYTVSWARGLATIQYLGYNFYTKNIYISYTIDIGIGRLKEMASTNKLYSVLLVIVVALIASAILASNYQDVVKSIYAFEPQNVTTTYSGTVETPEPMLSSSLQTKIWSLAPVGIFVGAGLAIFLMFFSGHRRRR